MNGLTREERNRANCFTPFNRRMVRSIFRISKSIQTDETVNVSLNISKREESICVWTDSFRVQVYLLEAKDSSSIFVKVESSIDVGIPKKEFEAFKKILSDVSDLSFRFYGGN